MRITLDLDQAAALHLSHALQRHREWCDQQPLAIPSALDELHRLTQIAKTRDGQVGSNDFASRDHATDDDAAPSVLTREQFAAACLRSTRTVRRWIAEGRVVEGIPRTELDRLKGQRRARTRH